MEEKFKISSVKNQQRLYQDLSWVWPIISPVENNEEDTRQFCDVIKKYSNIKVKNILHLGCGGGHNDYTLKKHFEVTGIDMSESMLKIAKQLNPEVTYLVGDIRKFRLEKMFDAVMIFDSAIYMLSQEDLKSVFFTAYSHLKSGGVFVTYVGQSREAFEQNKIRYFTHKKDNKEITCIWNIYDPDLKDCTCEWIFIFLIRQDGQLKIETDLHITGIFNLKTWHQLLNTVGFEVKQLEYKSAGFNEESFPLLVCQKPPHSPETYFCKDDQHVGHN